MHRKFRTITVRELREALEGLNDDGLVAFSCNYGDYHRTEQALGIDGEVEEHRLEPTAYSHSGWCVPKVEYEDDLDPEDPDDPRHEHPIVYVIN